jgi:hypothetical protein
MLDGEIIAMAYEMEAAYRANAMRDEAIEMVQNKIPDTDFNVLRGMWAAIDAYIDINCGEE